MLTRCRPVDAPRVPCSVASRLPGRPVPALKTASGGLRLVPRRRAWRTVPQAPDASGKNWSGRPWSRRGAVLLQSAHYYSNRSPIIPCAASNAQIADLARRFAAPGQLAGPISNGQRSIASTPVGSGPVRSTYYSYGNYGTSVITTLNVTLPGHPLHNGSVSRDWFRGADGAVWVETVGRGTNTSDFMAGANSIAGPPIFRGVDADAAAYAAKNICGRQ
jgi:hypothetical protein